MHALAYTITMDHRSPSKKTGISLSSDPGETSRSRNIDDEEPRPSPRLRREGSGSVSVDSKDSNTASSSRSGLRLSKLSIDNQGERKRSRQDSKKDSNIWIVPIQKLVAGPSAFAFDSSVSKHSGLDLAKSAASSVGMAAGHEDRKGLDKLKYKTTEARSKLTVADSKQRMSVSKPELHSAAHSRDRQQEGHKKTNAMDHLDTSGGVGTGIRPWTPEPNSQHSLSSSTYSMRTHKLERTPFVHKQKSFEKGIGQKHSLALDDKLKSTAPKKQTFLPKNLPESDEDLESDKTDAPRLPFSSLYSEGDAAAPVAERLPVPSLKVVKEESRGKGNNPEPKSAQDRKENYVNKHGRSPVPEIVESHARSEGDKPAGKQISFTTDLASSDRIKNISMGQDKNQAELKGKGADDQEKKPVEIQRLQAPLFRPYQKPPSSSSPVSIRNDGSASKLTASQAPTAHANKITKDKVSDTVNLIGPDPKVMKTGDQLTQDISRDGNDTAIRRPQETAQKETTKDNLSLKTVQPLKGKGLDTLPQILINEGSKKPLATSKGNEPPEEGTQKPALINSIDNEKVNVASQKKIFAAREPKKMGQERMNNSATQNNGDTLNNEVIGQDRLFSSGSKQLKNRLVKKDSDAGNIDEIGLDRVTASGSKQLKTRLSRGSVPGIRRSIDLKQIVGGKGAFWTSMFKKRTSDSASSAGLKKFGKSKWSQVLSAGQKNIVKTHYTKSEVLEMNLQSGYSITNIKQIPIGTLQTVQTITCPRKLSKSHSKHSPLKRKSTLKSHVNLVAPSKRHLTDSVSIKSKPDLVSSTQLHADSSRKLNKSVTYWVESKPFHIHDKDFDISPDSPDQTGEKPNEILKRLYNYMQTYMTPSHRRPSATSNASHQTWESNLNYIRQQREPPPTLVLKPTPTHQVPSKSPRVTESRIPKGQGASILHPRHSITSARPLLEVPDPPISAR